MRSIASRTGLPTLLVAVLALLGTGAATAPRSSASAKRAHGPVVVVKTARWTRGVVVLHVKARRDLHSAAVLVDGRRVDSDLPRHRGQRLGVVLDGADGIHFGRNRIAVKVRTRGGAAALVRRVVRVRREAPLPAIRQPRRVVASHAVRLDGRETRPARHGKLSFRWRVVGAPAGARFSLRDVASPRPRLVASVPGHYRVALTVTERGKQAQSAAATPAPCAIPGSGGSAENLSAPRGPIASVPLRRLPKGALTVVNRRTAATSPASGPQPRAVPGCATTVSDVEVEPNFEPIGVAIETRAEDEETAGIRLGDSFYPFPVNGEGGARFILLDARTLELIRTENVALNIPHRDMAQQMVAESAPNRDVLVVSSSRYACCSESPYAGFSAIESYADGRRGTATENQGVNLGPEIEGENQRHGELAGWLRPGVSLDGAPELFTFVNPERFAFDTAASSTSFSNTIRVGSAEYPASVSGAVGGFEVLVLGPDLEPELGTPVAFSTISSTGEGRAQEEAMTALLNRTGPLQTVIVQSIGNAQPNSGAATALGQALARLGASPWTFYSLNAGGYAFVGNGSGPVGPATPETQVAETSEQLARSVGGPVNGGGSLHGLLTRNAESALSPGLSDPTGTPNYELEQVTYQPGVAWPETETPGEIAATQYLAEALGLEPGPGSCYRPERPDFRSSYCDSSLDIGATENELERQKYPVDEKVSFTEAEFEAVQKQLGIELDDVADVRQMVSELQVPLGGQTPAVDSQKIAGEVLDALPQGSGSGDATAAKLSLAAAVLYAGEYVPEAGEVLGPIAAVLGLAGELAQENGEYSPDWRIQAGADEIGGKVKERLAAMSAGLGTVEEILVTDWGKLSTTAAKAGNVWGISSRGIQRQTSTIELGINQWMWRAILPAAFELVSFPGAPLGSQSRLYCITSIAPTEWSPWRKAPAESVFYPLVGFEGGRPVTSGAYAMLDGRYSKTSATRVSSALDEKIFGVPGKGAALTQPELFEDSSWTIARPHMIEEESPLKPGYCGF